MKQQDKTDLAPCHMAEASQGQCSHHSLMLLPISLSFSVSPSTLLPAQAPEGHLGHQEAASTSSHPGRIQVSSLQQEKQTMGVYGGVSVGCIPTLWFGRVLCQ